MGLEVYSWIEETLLAVSVGEQSSGHELWGESHSGQFLHTLSISTHGSGGKALPFPSESEGGVPLHTTHLLSTSHSDLFHASQLPATFSHLIKQQAVKCAANGVSGIYLPHHPSTFVSMGACVHLLSLRSQRH